MSAPVRIQRRRTAGWRMPEGAVYVGRPTKWGNPFRLRTPYALMRVPGAIDRSSDAEYEGRISADARLLGAYLITVGDVVRDLAGHDLACWCPLDQPCHADVLLELANAGASS